MTVNTNNRRNFIKTLAMSVASGLGLMAVNKTSAKIQPPTDVPAKPVTQGYRETQHIKAYYQSARF